MSCGQCKKKKPITKLPEVKNEKPPTVKKKRGRPKITKVKKKTIEEVYSESDINILKTNKSVTERPEVIVLEEKEYNYPSVDDLKFLRDWFTSRYKEDRERANKIYKMCLGEDIPPPNCRGCESRSHRKYLAFIKDMLD